MRAVAVVVVAGPDVGVTADHAFLLTHHEGCLGVGLQPDQPIDDVHPRLLQCTRPLDVPLFVEAGLELDQNGDLLAPVGGLDQRLHDRAARRGAVERLLYGEDIGVGGGGREERLDRSGEGVVGVMNEQIALADGNEDVRRLAVDARQPTVGHPGVGRPAEVLS